MKNFGKLALKLFALLCLLLTIGCEKTSLDELDEQEKIFEENLWREDQLPSEVNQQQSEDLGPLCEISRLDLAVVIDESGSMNITENGKSRLDAAKEGANSLVDQLNSGLMSALVSFNESADRLLDLTEMDEDGRNDMKVAINQLGSVGLTNIQGGIIFAAEELTGNEDMFSFINTNPSNNNRLDADKIIILLADGEPNSYYDENGEIFIESGPFFSQSRQKAQEAADVAKAAGIRIITIAIGEADRFLIQSLASSEEDFFTIDDINDLENLFQEIAGEFCPTRVEIDIKPASDPNSINMKKNGNIAVAVFSTEEFDAMTIDPETIRFGSIDAISSDEGAFLIHSGGHFEEDVNGDGKLDFVGHFANEETGFTEDDDFGWLVGNTLDGESIAGRDAVRILDVGKK